MKGLIVIILLAILAVLIAGPIGAGLVLAVALPVWLVAVILKGTSRTLTHLHTRLKPTPEQAAYRKQKQAHLAVQKGRHSICPYRAKQQPCLYELCGDFNRIPA